MQCTSPLFRAEYNTVYMNKKGGLSYNFRFLKPDEIKEYEAGMWENKIGSNKEYKRITKCGCGQCISCRLNTARDRATQMMLETIQYPEENCWFVTRTYDDEHLPHHTTKYLLEGMNEWQTVTGISLDGKNAQDYFKLLSYHFNKPIKKVYCGEYGSKTNRPHGHDIVWGLPLDVTKLEKYKTNEWGDPIWRCRELEKIWKKGNVMVGRVTWETCGYVARYTLKKSLGKTREDYNKWYLMNGKRPEYVRWSNGVGKDYHLNHWDEIWENDEVPILNKKTGEFVKPPLSYYRLLQKVDPNLHKQISDQRIIRAETLEQAEQMRSEMPPEERRAIAEARMKTIIQDMRRDI